MVAIDNTYSVHKYVYNALGKIVMATVSNVLSQFCQCKLTSMSNIVLQCINPLRTFTQKPKIEEELHTCINRSE